nr:putative protein TPRXL [Aegilops tauschii subsp. strangulata]
MVARSSVAAGNESLRPGSGVCLASDLTCGSTAPSSSRSHRRPSYVVAYQVPASSSLPGFPSLRQPPPWSFSAADALLQRPKSRHEHPSTASPRPCLSSSSSFLEHDADPAPAAPASSLPSSRRSAAGDQAAAAPDPCLDLLSRPFFLCSEDDQRLR